MTREHKILDLNSSRIPLTNDDVVMIYDSDDNRYKKVYLSSIYVDVYSEFKRTLSVGSMAYEDSSDYAVSSHGHGNYSGVSYVPNKTSGDLVLAISVLQYNEISDGIIGTLSNETFEIYTRSGSLQNTHHDSCQKLGEVRFDVQQSSAVNISSSGFDGWVYADGQTYDCSSFAYGQYLKKYMPCDNNGDKFCVRQISSFLENTQNGSCMPYSDNAKAMVYVGNSIWSKN